MDRYKNNFNRGLKKSPSLKKSFCLYWEVPDNPETLFGLEFGQSFEGKTVTREPHLRLIV